MEMKVGYILKLFNRTAVYSMYSFRTKRSTLMLFQRVIPVFALVNSLYYLHYSLYVPLY